MKGLAVVISMCAFGAVSGCSDQTIAPQASEECTVCEECTVVPTAHADLGPGGNVDEGRIGDYQFSSGRLDGDRKLGGTVGPITWTTDPTRTYVSWSVSGPHYGIAIVMKGGPQSNVYIYEDDCWSGRGLVCPTNSSGGPAQLSNITFYWNQCPDDC